MLLQTYPESAKGLEHQVREVNLRYIPTKSDSIVKIPFAETMQFQEAPKKLGNFHDFMIYNHLLYSKILKDVAKHYKDEVDDQGMFTHSRQDIYNYTVYKYHEITSGSQIRDVPIRIAMKDYLKKHENEFYALVFYCVIMFNVICHTILM